MTKNRFLINIYIFTIYIGSILCSVPSWIPKAQPILGLTDELFTILILIININKLLSSRFLKLRILLLLYISCGFIGGILNGAPLKILIFGAFISLKGILVYYSMSLINFNKDDINYFFKQFNYSFIIIAISLILNTILGDKFRNILNLPPTDMRMGIKSYGGIFAVYSTLSFLGFLYFLIYKYFLAKSKIKKSFTLYMLFAPLKVKEIFGAFIAIIILKFKKIKFSHVIIVVILSVILFRIYILVFPNHYNQYFNDNDDVARVVLVATSIKIANNNFPFGEGFGRYGGTISKQYYSPVFEKYNINKVWGLDKDGNDDFIQDTFWPMILGESGIIGMLLYLLLLWNVFGDYIKSYLKKPTRYNSFIVGLIIFSFITSLAKPVFVQNPQFLVIFGLAGMFKFSLQN